MPKLIKDGEAVSDYWTVLKEATGPEVLKAVPGKNFLVPLTFWKNYQEELSDYNGNIAIWLDSHDRVSDLDDSIHDFPLIALNFPAFSDGRSYSNARELRSTRNYQGEIRAIGDVLRDQLYYMQQCGFNAFAVRYDQDIDDCLTAFGDFTTGYQATVAEPTPLFRRR